MKSIVTCGADFIGSHLVGSKCAYTDILKIRPDLDRCPSISVEEGVEKIIENINYWKEATLWNSSTISKAIKDWLKYLSN